MVANDLMKNLDEKRKRALVQAREIAERAAAGEERAEDEEAYRKANVDYDRYSQMLVDERKRVEAEKADAEAFDAAARKAGSRTQEPEARKWTDDLRDALLKKESRKGQVNLTVSAADVEQRAGAVNTTTTGANVITGSLSHNLFRKLFDDVAVLQTPVSTMRTADGTSFKIPRLTGYGMLGADVAASMTAARVAEGGTIQKTVAPTFDQVEFNAYKYAAISQFTRELGQDSVIDIEGLIGQLLGRQMANYLAYDLLLGDGSSKPQGIVPLVPAGNTLAARTGAAGVIENVDQLIDIQWKLKPAYRKNAVWMLNDNTVLTLRKMKKGGTAGEFNTYVFEPGTADGQIDKILGHPVYVDPFMANQGANAVSIVYADMSLYYVRMVADLRIEWSTEYAWDTDLISVKGVLRADGDTIDNTAFAAFKGAAS